MMACAAARPATAVASAALAALASHAAERIAPDPVVRPFSSGGAGNSIRVLRAIFVTGGTDPQLGKGALRRGGHHPVGVWL